MEILKNKNPNTTKTICLTILLCILANFTYSFTLSVAMLIGAGSLIIVPAMFLKSLAAEWSIPNIITSLVLFISIASLFIFIVIKIAKTLFDKYFDSEAIFIGCMVFFIGNTVIWHLIGLGIWSIVLKGLFY